MSNKEAIELLIMAMLTIEWDYSMDYQIAFKKAIEALEEVDKFNRKLVYETIENHFNKIDFYNAPGSKVASDIIDILEKI